MKQSLFYFLYFGFFLINVSFGWAQAKDSIANLATEEYSVFNDFRVPVRIDINESDLRYDGWKTDAGRYVFRCRDGKRVRLTLWYLTKGSKEVIGSEFINVTEELDKCTKNDAPFVEPNYLEKRALLWNKSRTDEK